MVKNSYLTLFLALLIPGAVVLQPSVPVSAQTFAEGTDRDFSKAMEAFDRGMYERAMTLFNDIVFRTGSVKAEGYSVLCSVKSGVRGWENRMESLTQGTTRLVLSCSMD